MEPDRVPAGFWFHYPRGSPWRTRAQAHVDLCRSVGTDIIKIMDDNFGRFFTQGIRIEKASDWRHIRLPGKDCAHYRHMTGLIQRILDKSGGEAMVFPTMWSPFKIASFTYTDGGGTDQQFMAHCKEDPASVLEGVRALTETLQEWARDYLELGSSGLYYSGQFSEPQRFSEEEWARLVKPSDLAVLEVTKEILGKYNMRPYLWRDGVWLPVLPPAVCRGILGTWFNWDVHRAGLSLEEGRELFQKPILGGLDNHGVLVEGSLEAIRQETLKIIKAMGKRGFMLGADCTVPGEIDWARLRAAVEAAAEV